MSKSYTSAEFEEITSVSAEKLVSAELQPLVSNYTKYYMTYAFFMLVAVGLIIYTAYIAWVAETNEFHYKAIGTAILLGLFFKFLAKVRVDKFCKRQVPDRFGVVDLLEQISESSKTCVVTKRVTDNLLAYNENTLANVECKVIPKRGKVVKSKEPCVTVKISDTKYYTFFTDKVICFEDDNVGALSYSELDFEHYAIPYIEHHTVPDSSEVLHRTHKFITKEGKADRRYANNPRIYLCRYGCLEIKSASGFHLVLMYSRSLL